jgi:hypothetical protein
VAFTRKLLLVSVCVVALTGCGGGNGGDGSTPASTTTSGSSTTTSSADAAAIPEPAQPITDLIPAIEGLDRQDACAEAVDLLNQVDLPDPEGGASPRNCAAIGGVFGTLDGYKVSDTAEFGTAAIIDGTAPGVKYATQTATLDQTGHFKLLGSTTKGPQIGTEPGPGVDFEAPAATFVKALRDEDCPAAYATISPISRLSYGNQKQFCSVFKDNFLSDPSTLGARLQADPSADLVDFGGTRNLHFFGLPTEPAGYRTIVVGTAQGGEPLISDVVPVER